MSDTNDMPAIDTPTADAVTDGSVAAAISHDPALAAEPKQGVVAKLSAKASETATLTRERAEDAVSAARHAAANAAQTAADRAQDNPIVALVGGIALGAIAAALLPKTAREDKLFGSIGDTVRGAATTAAKAAREAGQSELETLGLTKDAAKGQFRTIVDKLGAVAKTASTAATDAIRTDKTLG